MCLRKKPVSMHTDGCLRATGLTWLISESAGEQIRHDIATARTAADESDATPFCGVARCEHCVAFATLPVEETLKEPLLWSGGCSLESSELVGLELSGWYYQPQGLKREKVSGF